MSETIKGLGNKSMEWKETFESKGLNVNLGKPTILVSSGITKDDLSKNKADPFGVCRLRVMANSVLYVQCGRWIHGRCAGMNGVTATFSRNFACRKCEGNIGEAV